MCLLGYVIAVLRVFFLATRGGPRGVLECIVVGWLCLIVLAAWLLPRVMRAARQAQDPRRRPHVYFAAVVLVAPLLLSILGCVWLAEKSAHTATKTDTDEARQAAQQFATSPPVAFRYLEGSLVCLLAIHPVLLVALSLITFPALRTIPRDELQLCAFTAGSLLVPVMFDMGAVLAFV